MRLKQIPMEVENSYLMSQNHVIPYFSLASTYNITHFTKEADLSLDKISFQLQLDSLTFKQRKMGYLGQVQKVEIRFHVWQRSDICSRLGGVMAGSVVGLCRGESHTVGTSHRQTWVHRSQGVKEHQS